MICPEKKWRELSSFLITSGYVNAAKLPWAVGSFLEFVGYGLCWEIYYWIFIIKFGFFSEGWCRPGAEVYIWNGFNCAPQDVCFRVQSKTSKYHSYISLMHRFNRGKGDTGKRSLALDTCKTLDICSEYDKWEQRMAPITESRRTRLPIWTIFRGWRYKNQSTLKLGSLLHLNTLIPCG